MHVRMCEPTIFYSACICLWRACVCLWRACVCDSDECASSRRGLFQIEIDTGSVVLEMAGTGYYVPGSPYRSVKLNDAIYCRTSTINANKSGPLAHRRDADTSATSSSPSPSPQKGGEIQSKLVVSTSSVGDKASSSVPLGVFCAAPQADDRSRKSGWAVESGINVLVLDKRSLRPIFDKTYNTYAYGRARAGEEAFVSLCDDFCGSDLGNIQKFKFTADDIFIVTVRSISSPCTCVCISLRVDPPCTSVQWMCVCVCVWMYVCVPNCTVKLIWTCR